MRTHILFLAVLAGGLLIAMGAAPALAASSDGAAPAIGWQHLLGGIGNDYGQSIQQTADGGYILLGYSSSSANGDVADKSHGGSDIWVTKLDGAGAIQWQKLLGGIGNDYGQSVQQTADGGYVLVGYSYSYFSGDVTGPNHGHCDVWVAKLDEHGATQWQRLLGGNAHDYGQSIQQTADGGYVLVGGTNSSASGDVTGTNNGAAGTSAIWMVKLDDAGVIQWQKLFGGSGEDFGRSVQQTTDGGYILAGYAASKLIGNGAGENHGGNDFWVAKLDGVGAIQWQKLLGGKGDDYGRSVQQTADGGYILVGGSGSSASGDVLGTNQGDKDIWVVKLDEFGAIGWQSLLGGSGYDYGKSIRQTVDGGYILVGDSTSSANGDVAGVNHGSYDYWVAKLDGYGAIQWQQLLGGSKIECANSVQQANDGGYIFAGYSYSSESADVTGTNHGVDTPDFWVVKLNASPAGPVTVAGGAAVPTAEVTQVVSEPTPSSSRFGSRRYLVGTVPKSPPSSVSVGTSTGATSTQRRTAIGVGVATGVKPPTSRFVRWSPAARWKLGLR